LVAVASVVAMRMFESTIIDEFELIASRTPERDILVFVEFPARHVVEWRDCVLAIGARSGLVAVGAGSDYDIGNRAEEQVSVYATGGHGSQPGAKTKCNMYMHMLHVLTKLAEGKSAVRAQGQQLTYKSTINGIVL
jgi:hypothetical protein